MTVALIICNLTSIIAVVGAIIVMNLGNSGWGWLIVVAIITHSTPN